VSDWSSYDSIAQRYDDVWGSRFEEVARHICECFALPPGSSVLDIGSGTGIVLHALGSHALDGARLVGCDKSAGMIRVARSRVPAGRFVEANAVMLPFRNFTFHAATASFVLSHLRDYEAGLAEARRVLKPGGVLAMASWSADADVHGETWRTLLADVVPKEGLQAAVAHVAPCETHFERAEGVEAALTDAGRPHAYAGVRDFAGPLPRRSRDQLRGSVRAPHPGCRRVDTLPRSRPRRARTPLWRGFRVQPWCPDRPRHASRMTGTVKSPAAGAPRRAGRLGGPALWLVHALGDSSRAFASLLTNSLSTSFDLLAPDWPGAGEVPFEPRVADLDGLADWLARAVDGNTPNGPVGLVGHSLGAAVAVRAVSRLRRVVGVFSIEGNLTASDAYLSGLATAFDTPQEYRDHVLGRVSSMARGSDSGRSEALWRYHANLILATPQALWRIGRSAAAASRMDALGDEYQALSVPSLYYWSRETTPPETQDYIRRHALRNVEFAGGHWPMVERPRETANEVAAFFEPLFRISRPASEQ